MRDCCFYRYILKKKRLNYVVSLFANMKNVPIKRCIWVIYRYGSLYYDCAVPINSGKDSVYRYGSVLWFLKLIKFGGYKTGWAKRG